MYVECTSYNVQWQYLALILTIFLYCTTEFVMVIILSSIPLKPKEPSNRHAFLLIGIIPDQEKCVYSKPAFSLARPDVVHTQFSICV